MDLGGPNELAVDRPRRSEYAFSFLTPQQATAAVDLTAVELAMSASGDLWGRAAEALLADITGGEMSREPNAPFFDIWRPQGRRQIRFSVKTKKVRATRRRPTWQEWIGHSLCIPLCSLEPRQQLPRGRDLFSVKDFALGRRIEQQYNEDLQQSQVERIGILVRGHIDLMSDHSQDWREEPQTRFLYWEQDLAPIPAGSLRWSDSDNARPGWSRILHARASTRAGDDGPADLIWNGGKERLYARFEIPATVDTWVVPDCMIPSRKEVKELVSAQIRERLTSNLAA